MKPSMRNFCPFLPVGRVAGFIELNKLSEVTPLGSRGLGNIQRYVILVISSFGQSQGGNTLRRRNEAV